MNGLTRAADGLQRNTGLERAHPRVDVTHAQRLTPFASFEGVDQLGRTVKRLPLPQHEPQLARVGANHARVGVFG